MKKVLIFHPTIAPYRIDFFNDLYHAFDTHIALYYENLKDQKFNYDEISSRFEFEPDYFDKTIRFLGREIPIGYIKRLREKSPDIVLVSEYDEGLWVSLLYRCLSSKKYKILSVCDDSEKITEEKRGNHAKARRIAMKYIDGVVLCNHDAQKVYKNKFPKMKTCVMPIIHDEKRYLKDRNELISRSKEIVQKEKLSGKRVFLYVGRIAPEKNLEYLIESFVANHNEYVENILYIIGDSTQWNQLYAQKIENAISENHASSYIRKIGRREGKELKSWYFASQVFVLPSKWEPFGAVTNEALLCGDFVLISSAAGSTCLVNDSNGEIIDINKPSIDMENICCRVPLMTEKYLDNKISKMKYSYSYYMNHLIDWIRNI